VLYEIDLSIKNANKLRSTLQRFTTTGRRVGGRSTRGRASSREQVAGSRAWALANGYEVSSRERIPLAFVEAYNAG
jgi:hypothetical protein